MMKQHYLTWEERHKIEALTRAKIPVANIAKILGCCRQTIYNELKRGEYLHDLGHKDERRYSPKRAQEKTDYMQTGKGRPVKIGHDYEYAAYLEMKIKKERYSPAAALAAAKEAGYKTTICTATLYSYIENKVLNINRKNLWYKPKQKKKRQPARIAHPTLPSITDRPEYINERSDRGHWEMDLIVGCKKSNHVLLTLTERVTRRELIYKLPNRKAETIKKVFDQLEKKMPNFKEEFKSITTDNGSEFLRYKELKSSIYGGERFAIYYCHSYAAWEKGTNENHNRMIRRWFPKGTDFGQISNRAIETVQYWMNHYPRKILNWKYPEAA